VNGEIRWTSLLGHPAAGNVRVPPDCRLQMGPHGLARARAVGSVASPPPMQALPSHMPRAFWGAVDLLHQLAINTLRETLELIAGSKERDLAPGQSAMALHLTTASNCRECAPEGPDIPRMFGSGG
jgi:hypothetical protein